MEKSLLFKKQLLLLLLPLSSFCYAQVTEEWVARHNGPGNAFDAGVSLALDAAGNVYVLSSSTGAGTGLDFSTIKYNAAGVLQWEARYNGPANDEDMAFSLAVDSLGNVYVTGRSMGTTGVGSQANDFATIKYNTAGVEQWVVRYNGPGNGLDVSYSIGVDGEGNVYVTGLSVGAGTGGDYATVKYNNNGIQQWVARYDGPGNTDEPLALAVDAAGNVYVTGRSSFGIDLDEEDKDITTIRYDTNGNELWVRRYDGPVDQNRFDEGLAITVDRSGNVYVTGSSVNSNLEDANDYATVKYDANGNELWSARYNGPGNSIDRAWSIAVDASQNVYVTGFSAAAPEETNYDFATIRYDANGNEVWVRRYDGPANDLDQAASLALDGEGNVYVCGTSTGTGTGRDIAVIKYNAAGEVQWVARYNGPANGNDAAVGNLFFSTQHLITVDETGNVYVTGSSAGIGTGSDVTTIKYSQGLPVCGAKGNKVLICHKGKKTLCIPLAALVDHLAHGDVVGSCDEEDRVDLSGLAKYLLARFRLFNTPNPVYTNTRIYYELHMDGQVSLQVYDMMGREIGMLFNGFRKAGFYYLDFDASSLPKGVYNYRITLNTKTKLWVLTKKIVVAK